MKYLYEENYESFIKRMKDDHDIEFIAEVSSNDVIITMLHNGIKVVKKTYPLTYLFNHVEKLRRKPIDYLSKVKKSIDFAVRKTAMKYLYNINI